MINMINLCVIVFLIFYNFSNKTTVKHETETVCLFWDGGVHLLLLTPIQSN